MDSHRQVLLKSPYLRIVRMPSHLEMECLGDRITSKRDVSTIALFYRKYCALTGNNKLLVILPRVWGLDMAAWDLVNKEGFFGDYFLAFISTELYQTLLLRELEHQSPHVKIFKTREQAEEWLGTQT